MHRNTLLSCLVLTIVLIGSACSRERRYPLVGQVVAVHPARQEITVKHEDIRGFMPGMTMPFKVHEAAQMAGLSPGDLITASLVVEESLGYLDEVKKTGQAPLPPGLETATAPIIEAGAEVPDVAFTDQDGRTRRFSDWRGQTTAVTFVYTRCPMPDFCPLMDRQFAEVQRALKAEPALAKRVHLLSVSFDPEYDTPAVLGQHAARVGADADLWSYVTGSREAIESFAAVFGVSVLREDRPMEEIVHNLRTAVVGPDGRLVDVLNGNGWTPAQLLAAIRSADAGR